ncbi:signal peptidase II [Candidatus Pelagibacter communis]|uniref:signal peptidase II n=1 Tax=Pelagibacter ubique TaxID=198252 RepID=UPI00094DBB5B|nr:signal peptidase II [Candidatus Pelagibacter ubique]
MHKKNLLYFSMTILIFLIDRISKYFILKLSTPTGDLNISITSFLNFNLIWNSGVAFGLLSFDQNIYYNIVTAIIILVTSILIWIAIRAKGLEKISFLLIIGGSFGNMFDRLYYSAVIDFIDITYNDYHWFIFNVADIFICIGVILLIILEFFKIKVKV